MTTETEIPEVCKQYDELSRIIQCIESEIERLENEVEPKTETIKKYIQLLKDGKEAGIGFPLHHFYINDDGSTTTEKEGNGLDYYRNKISEIDQELIENDKIIKANKTSLQVHYKELEDLEKQIVEIGWRKIGFMFGGSKWYPDEEGEDVFKKSFGASRIV